MALYELLRPSMRVWYAGMLAHAGSVPDPRDRPVNVGGDAYPDRVLLLGNGVTHGWGVVTHELSAVGHLRRSLTRRSGRPTAVDYVGDERMTIDSAEAWLGDRAGDGYDVVVVAVGLNDALRLTPVERWTERYARLLDRILTDLDREARVVVVALPRVGRFTMARGFFGAVAQRHAKRLTEVVRDLAALRPRTTAVTAPQERFETASPLGSSALYAEWAEQLAADVAPVLDAVRAAKPAEAASRAEWDWTGTPEAIARAAEDGGYPRLTGLAHRAKERFGVALAAVNVVDGDRVWIAGHSGGAPVALPRSIVYCGRVADEQAELVVLDADRDPRFQGNPFVDVTGLPFYAGVPLRAADGATIGTMCVLDAAPHDGAHIDMPALRRFAAEAEAELRRLDAVAPPEEALTRG